MVPSLQNICGVPVMVVILNHPTLKKEIFSTSSSKLHDEPSLVRYLWKQALQDVASNILKEYYNPVLKSVFPMHLIEYGGIEMLKWAEHVQTCFDLPLKFSQNFMKSSFYTSEGLIDEEKAARELVSEPSLSIFLKYKIACHYFLEDIIPHLWQEFQNEEPSSKKIKLSPETPMVMWSEHLVETKLTSVSIRPSITRHFKKKILSYGFKYKNVAAVKFSLCPEDKCGKSQAEIDRERELVHRSFCNCLNWFVNYDSRRCYLYSKDSAYHYNLIKYFISVIEKEELKELLVKSYLTFTVLKCFLLWPFQNHFIYAAELVYDNLNKEHFYQVISKMFSSNYFNCSYKYNYRPLLREFWIKSPSHLKKYFIDYESDYYNTSNKKRVTYLLLELTVRMQDCTSDDFQTIYTLLKDANSTDKNRIFKIQGKNICGRLCSLGKFEMADFFLYKCVGLNEETARTFKKNFSFDFFNDMLRDTTKCVDDEFFKWVVGSDEIDELKDEFFYKLTHASAHIELLFSDFPNEEQFFVTNNNLKYFLKTDAKIEEWKKNALLNLDTVYSPFFTYENPDWFDEFLIYLGYSYEETPDFNKSIPFVKKVLLNRRLPEIAKVSLNSRGDDDYLEQNILYLCSYERGKIKEFKDALYAFYEDSIKQKMCLLCMSSRSVSVSEHGTLHCEHHGTNGFVSFDNINEICYAVSERIDLFCFMNKWKMRGIVEDS